MYPISDALYIELYIITPSHALHPVSYTLHPQFKGYIFKIMGGNDKQGFGMKQGVLTASRVFLLMTQKTSGFRGIGRRKGERRRKVKGLRG